MKTSAKNPREKPPAEPWQELDWSSGGPHGAAKLITKPLPCVICQKPAYLLSPKKLVPTHKTCAERYYLIGLLCGILRALADVPRDALR